MFQRECRHSAAGRQAVGAAGGAPGGQQCAEFAHLLAQCAPVVHLLHAVVGGGVVVQLHQLGEVVGHKLRGQHCEAGQEGRGRWWVPWLSLSGGWRGGGGAGPTELAPAADITF
jgi:hypothetical protein